MLAGLERFTWTLHPWLPISYGEIFAGQFSVNVHNTSELWVVVNTFFLWKLSQFHGCWMLFHTRNNPNNKFSRVTSPSYFTIKYLNTRESHHLQLYHGSSDTAGHKVSCTHLSSSHVTVTRLWISNYDLTLQSSPAWSGNVITLGHLIGCCFLVYKYRS